MISSSDVEWIIDEKTGWSACSKTCAGGKATFVYGHSISKHNVQDIHIYCKIASYFVALHALVLKVNFFFWIPKHEPKNKQ